MVARDFSLQDLPYTRLLQLPDEDREFLALDELKPHQLTELSGIAGTHSNASGTSSGSNNNYNVLQSAQLSPSAAAAAAVTSKGRGFGNPGDSGDKVVTKVN